MLEFGLTHEQLETIRSKVPRERIVEAARLAFKIDDEPNSDLIEYIAGYEARGGFYHHFRNMKEILDIVGKPRTVVPLPKAVDEPFGLDLEYNPIFD